jgi:Xaa-Pro aminopeptidase
MSAVAPIPREEFAARVARVRGRMVESGLDALVCYGAHVDYAPGDLRYLADWFCIEEEQALLIVPAGGPVTLLTDSSADVDRAREQAVCDEVVLTGDLGGAAAVRLRGCSTAGLTGMRLLPAAAMDSLRAGAPGVRLDDASALTAGLRMLKSPAEVALLAEAARISDLGMAAGLEAVREGAREIEMAAAAEHAIRVAGAELSFTTVAGAGPRTALLAGGTIAGSVLTMDRAFQILIGQVGLGLVDAATICATTPARELGLVGHGVLAPEAPADLVVLDANFSVVQTYVAGQLVYARGQRTEVTEGTGSHRETE